MMIIHRLGTAVILVVVVGILALGQITVSNDARNDPDFQEAWKSFLATEEGMRIYISVWMRSVLSGIGGPSQPVTIQWVPNNELDPPAGNGAYGNVNTTAAANGGSPGIVIKVRSVKTGGKANLTDTIHHELRHAEIYLDHGSESAAENPAGHNTAKQRHDDLDDGKDAANNRFKFQHLINSIRDLFERFGNAVEEIISPLRSWALDEKIAYDYWDAFSFSRLLHESLFVFDGDGGIAESKLVESWEISDDQHELTVHLSRGLQFHSGDPFTSADVVFTYQRLLDAADENPYFSYWLFSHDLGDSQLEQVEAIDNYTATLTFGSPIDLSWASERALDDGPNPLWEMAWIPILSNDVQYSSPEYLFMTGLGPYKIYNYIDYALVELVLFDAIADDAELPMSATFPLIEEATVQMLAFVAGDLNLLLPPAELQHTVQGLLADGTLIPEQVVPSVLVDWDSETGETTTIYFHMAVSPELADSIVGIADGIQFGGVPHTSRSNDRRTQEE